MAADLRGAAYDKAACPFVWAAIATDLHFAVDPRKPGIAGQGIEATMACASICRRMMINGDAARPVAE